MKNIAIICMGIFALCFFGCGGDGNQPDAPTSLDGYTYGTEFDDGFSIVFDETTYTLTGDSIANGSSGEELTGTYTYSSSRNKGTAILNTGGVNDYTIIFEHTLIYGDGDSLYKRTGKRYSGPFYEESGEETNNGRFEAYITSKMLPVEVEAPSVEVLETAPVSAN